MNPLPDLTPEQIDALDSRMDAYYYSFDRTGVPEIDRILSAVAWAGKAYHHTDQWSDETEGPYGARLSGMSHVDVIQQAANAAAKYVAERAIGGGDG